LTNADIPHRTHLHDIPIKKYEDEIDRIRKELQASLGRISFTCDLWTCKLLRGYLAITIHY
ncbi:hypothetical protein C8Q79DRAFT_893836, partial [Trametes meyenii]